MFHFIYNLEQPNSVGIQNYLEVATITLIGLFNVAGHLSKQGLLNSPFHNPGMFLVIINVQMGCDYGSTDIA